MMLYDANGILLKSVSNKRWVKNLCESQTSFLNKLDPIILKYCNLGSIFGVTTKQIIGLAIIGDALSLPASTKNLELEMKNMCEQETSISFFGNKIINCGDSYTKKDIIVFAPVIFLDLDVKSGNYENRYEIVFNTAKSKSDILSAEQLLTNYLTRNNYMFWGDSLSYINKNFPSLIDKLERFSNKTNNEYTEDDYEESNDLEINEIKIKQKENVNVDTSDDVSVKGSLEWTIRNASEAQNKNLGLKNGIIPEIRTSSLVNDEKFRTLENCCDMVISNITAMKNNLKIFGGKSKNKALIIDDDIEDIDFFNRKWTEEEIEKNNELYPEAISAMESKYGQKIQARICYVYYQMMVMAKKGDYSSNFKHSQGLNYCLHNYPIELSSPMSVIDNAIEWNKLNGQSGLNVLQNVVGLPYSQWRANSYIMYPLSATMPLADSIICLNHKIIKCSTKGGLNGKGAAASLKSLREYVYEGENGQGNITKFGKNIQQQYPNLFGIFDKLTKFSAKEFSNRDWNELYEYIRKETNDLNIDTTKQVQDYINKPLNEKWSKMIMKILESASYDFIQVNATKTSTNSDFHFTYKAQYPAVYNGKVELIIKKDGFSQFHIL